MTVGRLFFLLNRVPFAALRSGFARGQWVALTASTFLLAALTLVAEAALHH